MILWRNLFMNKKSGHNIKFKSIFVCTSAIMSLWLGANLTTTQVHAAEDNAAPKSSEVVGQTLAKIMQLLLLYKIKVTQKQSSVNKV